MIKLANLEFYEECVYEQMKVGFSKNGREQKITEARVSAAHGDIHVRASKIHAQPLDKRVGFVSNAIFRRQINLFAL